LSSARHLTIAWASSPNGVGHVEMFEDIRHGADCEELLPYHRASRHASS
jgi:hypothetical protein